MNISMKKGLLALAGALALGGAGATQAQAIYQGQTQLTTTAAGSTTCTLTLVASVDSSGNIEVVSAGATPGGTNCPFIRTGNLSWTGSKTTTTLSTNADSTLIYPGFLADTCGGTVTDISYGPDYMSTNYPDSVQITPPSGINNYGTDCRIEGNLSLVPDPF